MNKSLLITGTNTEVGKTILTTCLASYWQTYRHHENIAVMKLIQTGYGDREFYEQLFGDKSTIEIVNPLHFEAPLAPPVAAAKEGKEVNLEIVWRCLSQLQQKKDFVLIEALGGLGSPVTWELTVGDLARDWRLPTVLVVPVRLGAISEAVVNSFFARQSKINLRGIILSCIKSDSESFLEEWAPIDLLQSLTNVPVLGVLPYLHDTKDISKFAQIASHLDIEKLIC